jgi:hypothetical protein
MARKVELAKLIHCKAGHRTSTVSDLYKVYD